MSDVGIPGRYSARVRFAILLLGCTSAATPARPEVVDASAEVTDAPDVRCTVPSIATPRPGLRCTRYPFALAAPRDVVEVDGAIYVTEMSAGRVVRLTDGGFVPVASGLTTPIGIRSADGKLIVSEEGAHTVSRIDPATGEKVVLARDLGNVTYLTIGPDGATYVSSFTALDTATGVVKRVGDTVSDYVTGVNVPEGLAFDGTSLLVVEWGRPSKVSRGGTVVASGFDRAYGIAKSDRGWFVSDTTARVVVEVLADGTRENVLTNAATPAGLFRASNGDLLVVEHGSPAHNGIGYLVRLSAIR